MIIYIARSGIPSGTIEYDNPLDMYLDYSRHTRNMNDEAITRDLDLFKQAILDKRNYWIGCYEFLMEFYTNSTPSTTNASTLNVKITIRNPIADYNIAGELFFKVYLIENNEEDISIVYNADTFNMIITDDNFWDIVRKMSGAANFNNDTIMKLFISNYQWTRDNARNWFDGPGNAFRIGSEIEEWEKALYDTILSIYVSQIEGKMI